MKSKVLLFISCALICILNFEAAHGQQKKYSLWYEHPAPNRGGDFNIIKNGGFPYDEDWERWSLPIGNGYMGACIFGCTDTERIQLTEKTLGNESLWGLGGIENFAEIYLDINHASPANYRRELCIDDAICTVGYQYDGVNYLREYFANYPNNVIAVKLKADQPGKITFTLRPILPYLREYGADKNGRTGKVTAQGDLITMTGKAQFYNLPYEAQIRVLPYGGHLKTGNDALGDNGTITVQQADSVVLYIHARTAYQLGSDLFCLPADKKISGEHPHKAVTECMRKAVEKGYETLRKEHIADYRSFFARVNLQLTDDVPAIPTDRLLYDCKSGKPSLYMDELLFQYGRYLLIASSRKGALPPNLQGAWSQFQVAPWTGGYWHNVNVQMNYWPAFNTNLAELFVSYVDYNEAFRKAANKQATDYVRENNPEALSDIEGENGWAIGTGASAYTIFPPGGHSGPGTGGFTTKLFWDYYDFTRDEEILRKHSYPAILGMSKFLSKTLKPSENGCLLADPSSSPEQQMADGKYYVTKGCAFDQGMIWENHHDLLKAAHILHIKDPFLKTVEEQIGKLDAIQIGESGQIKEFREEKKYGDIGEPHHRHISHLCALYPGTLINSATAEWMKAAIVTLNNRGDKSTGWAMAHRLNLWARTKDGDRAYRLYQQMQKQCIVENLWDVHPPFQIDGNFGATAGIAEMLLQSHEGYIEPLPALPAAWSKGAYDGLVARGNFVVSVAWEHRTMTRMSILSRKGEECIVKYNGIEKAIVVDAKGKKIKAVKYGNNMLKFATQQGKVYRIEQK